jgi:hypothetical protein
MHTLSLLVSFMVVFIIPNLVSAIPEPTADKNPDHYHDKQKCLNDHESRDIIERYISNFETIDEASVIETFTEDFKYESDSTNFLLRSNVSSSVRYPEYSQESLLTCILHSPEHTQLALAASLSLFCVRTKPMALLSQ